VTMTVTKKEPGATAKVSGSGKIHVAQPGAFVTATLAIKNTSSTIANIKPLPEDSDFVIGEITGPRSFKVHLKPDRLTNVKMAKQVIYPEITLKSGKVVKPKLTLTPAFAAGRKHQSANAATLYRHAPHHGANLSLDILTPKDAKLGFVEIDPVSYNNLGFADGKGLELIPAGHKTWTIAFKNYEAPVMKKLDSKGNPVALKPNYTLKIHLWAVGTYLTEADGVTPKRDAVTGRIIPLHNDAAKAKDRKNITKPTVVNVKVNVK